MANERFFSAGDFSSSLAAPFFGAPPYVPPPQPGLDVAACAAAMAPAAFGMLPWADHLMRADSSATTAHFDSALSSLVSSPAHASGGGGDDVAIGDLIGRLGSICNTAAASANNSCYSTPLSSPPRGASPAAAALPFRAGYPGGGGALETGRLSRVSSSKSLGTTAPAATPAALENAEAGTSPKVASSPAIPDPPPAKGDGAARKRKAAAKGKASSSAMTAATNASPKRSKVADGGDNSTKDATAAAGEEEEEKKAPEPAKDYIHVRARRGQATDSHSLAERVRRERISERMKMLQSLVPGCNKITGKALMLDEIINYVQSLQRQVEFLSMKLSTMNPHTDLDAHYLPSDKDTVHQPPAMLAYPSSDAPAAAFSYADPFAAGAVHPTLQEPCGGSFHAGAGFGWEAQDLQSIIAAQAQHDMAAAPASPPASQPHHGFYGK
ncbi:hypothetical protein ACP70R_011882 [Stipagrostis hirtigluma subsp. patula]